MKLVQIKLMVLLALLLGFAVAESSELEKNADARRSLAHVDSLLIEDRLPEAVAATVKFQKQYLDDLYWKPLFDGRLAVALLRSGRSEEALPLLEAQVIDNPSLALAHRNLGACLLALGRRGRALSEYQQVVELEPRNAAARLEYGQILLDFRILKDAGREILAAASLCGDCSEVQPALARYYMAMNQPSLAAPHWEAVWVDTANPIARQNYLKALLDSGQDTAALKFLSSLQMSSLSGAELQQLVAVEGRMGKWEQSLRFADLIGQVPGIEEIAGQVADDPLFWGRVSLNLLESQHYPESLTAVLMAISLDPENIVYLNNRVVLLQKLGREEEAVREWEKVQALKSETEGK